MKLTYRGQSYERTAVQSGAAAVQPKTKLIYRGQTYYPTSHSADPEAASEIGSMIALRYRGIVYGLVLRSLKPCYPSGAINWRYQTGH